MGLVKKNRQKNMRVAPMSTKERLFTIELYEHFLEILDRSVLITTSSINVLCLNAENTPGFIFTLPDYSDLAIRDAFMKAKSKNSAAIVVGLNEPSDELYITKRIDEYRKNFVSMSEEYKIPVIDVMVFSPWGFTSYRESGLRLK